MKALKQTKIKLLNMTEENNNSDILRVRDFEPALTEYSKMETNNFGGKKMWINYSGRKSFRFQFPRMEAPFGVSDFTDPATGKTKYYLNLTFKKESDMKGVLKMFHEKMTAWDEKIIEDASQNTVAWFKKPAAKMTKNVIRKNYTPMLNKYKDPTTLEFTGLYADKLKLKIPFWNDSFSVEVYDEAGVKTDINYIKPHSEIIAVIKSANIWFTGDKFGCSLNGGVLQVFPPERLTGYSFLPDLAAPQPAQPAQPAQPVRQDNDDEGVDTGAAEVASTPVPVVAKSATSVAAKKEVEAKESSEEESSEEEEEAKPAATPAPAKATPKKEEEESSDDEDDEEKEEEKEDKKKRVRPTARTAGADKATKKPKAATTKSAFDKF